VFILKGVKVVCFDTLSEVFILKGLSLHQYSAGWRALKPEISRGFGTEVHGMEQKRWGFGREGLGRARMTDWRIHFTSHSSMDVNICQELLVSDSNGCGKGDTVGFKLAEGKGLGEWWDSKELWKSVEKHLSRPAEFVLVTFAPATVPHCCPPTPRRGARIAQPVKTWEELARRIFIARTKSGGPK